MHNLLCSMSAELAVSSLPLEVWMIYWSCHSCILLSHSCCLLSGIAPPILCWSVLSVSLQNICAANSAIYVQVMMTDPVIAADGHSYEKAAMEDWLQNHAMSPVTKQALDHPWLTPNINLRKFIAAVCQHALCKH